MRCSDGSIRFCEGCPAAGSATGANINVVATDYRYNTWDAQYFFQKPTYAGIEVSREITAVDDDGGIARLPSDLYGYTRKGDANRVLRSIEGCQEPDTEDITMRPFFIGKRVKIGRQVTCSAFPSYTRRFYDQ